MTTLLDSLIEGAIKTANIYIRLAVFTQLLLCWETNIGYSVRLLSISESPE